MTDFTPETHIVRARYSTYGNVPDELWETAMSVHGPEFDRWLASVKAEAWEQGVKYALGHDLDADFWTPDDMDYANPHRSGESND